VKPENILLEQGSGRAMVADFGIAQLAQASGGTGHGEVLGTPDFMSPEQACGERVDGRSDLYSLGVVGFYALTGKLPFEGPTASAVIAMHLTQPPSPVGSVGPIVPRALASVVDRCLAKNPAERFQSGEELAEALGSDADRRRQIPVPVRVFLRDVRRVAVAFSWIYVFVLPQGFFFMLSFGGAGLGPVFLLVGAASMFLLMAPPGLLLLLATVRRLRKAGQDQDDVALALTIEIELRREETQFQRGVRRTPMERLAGALIGAAVGLGIAFIAILTFSLSGARMHLWVLIGLAGSVVVTGALVALTRRSAQPGLKSFWARFWRGPLGRWMFRIAGLGLRQWSIPLQGRPTELAIAAAAGAVFESLPRQTRRALSDLPEVVGRLELRAQDIRGRIDDLEQLIAESNVGVRPEVQATRRESLIADLTLSRDAAQHRLSQVVAAMETIRLDLLRLKAGAGSLEGVTADLTAAREVGEEVDLLLEGHKEIEEELGRPGQ
jgi:serine/threonine-protein kinase